MKKNKTQIGGTLNWVYSNKGILEHNNIIHEILGEDLKKSKLLDGDIIDYNPFNGAVKLIERPKKEYSGIIISDSKTAFFIKINNKKVWLDFILYKNKKTENLKLGDRVIVKLIEWTGKSPEVELVEYLGQTDDWNATVNSILVEFGLPHKFPDRVEAEAEEIIEYIDLTGREDIRNIWTCTIDPVSAKDFDDALSVLKLSDNSWEIGVHIADVSYYVKPGSIIDKEAYKRANSIYLLDRVVPMLPEKLSNNLCSLVPNRDRYALSIFFTIEGTEIKSWRWSRTVINSNRRYSYEEVWDILSNNSGEGLKNLTILNNIAKRLNTNRIKNGAIILETAEVKPLLVNDRIEYIKKERNDAHKLIEEWMLLANIYAAKTVKSMRTGIFRHHPEPDEERIEKLALMSKAVGHDIDLSNIATGINSIITIEDKPLRDILMSLAQRSMSKAVYDAESMSHFGLAFEEYTHQTSPIRRYCDLQIHRMLIAMIEGDPVYSENLSTLCNYLSRQERLAQEAERAVLKQRQITDLKSKIGVEYTAIVTGISERGVWCELSDIYCEGMINSKLLTNWFISDSGTAIKNKNNKIKFGQIIKVKILSVNIDKRLLDLELLF